MDKIFIETDGSVEMSMKIVEYLKSLGGVREHVDYFVKYSLDRGARLFLIDSDGVGDIEWGSDPDHYRASGYTEIFLPSPKKVTRHKHYDVIVKWAEDPSQKVWFRKGGYPVWSRTTNPQWSDGWEYHVGENYPIDFNPIAVDSREKFTHYYVASVCKPEHYVFLHVSEIPVECFERGLVFCTREAAVSKAKSLLGC